MSKFINGDCMTGMDEYPDNHFDLAIVDPPYGIGYDKIQDKCAGTYRTQNGGTWKKYHKTDWDNNIPDKKYFNDYKKLIKQEKEKKKKWMNYYYILHYS